MRLNKPVTNKEFDFDGSRSLYSTTDLRGCITFANPYFVEVSGFSEDELIGQPHNIVRHPDMPPAAFGDLWTTIKSGMPWTALVKNRRKNGDHYWVQATVTPIFENGVATGFMSVRTKPTREQITAAEALYKAENERPGSLRLRRGRVLPNGMRARIIDSCELSLTARFGLIHAILLTLVGALGATAFLPHQLAALRPELATGLTGLTATTLAMSWRQLITKAVAPIKEAAALVQSIAGGDLTLTIDAAGTGETGDLMRALRQLSVNLKSLIGDIRENFSMIRSVTGELAQGNSDLSARTDSQASSLEETAASMEELTSTVRQNLDNTNQAGGVAKSAMATAERGGELMNQVVATIGEISASSEKIANIVNIINSIASQTNLLALNAAVESARAGEAGRGFAVVATEVRNLAQRSAEAAKDIKGLIDNSVEKINAGTVLSRDAGTIMQEIIVTVGRVSKVMNDIAAASAEQSTGIEQVNDAITQMDEVTQRNASLVEMAASATNGLQDQGRKLMQSLAIFKLGQIGNGPPAAADVRPSNAGKTPRSARRLAAA